MIENDLLNQSIFAILCGLAGMIVFIYVKWTKNNLSEFISPDGTFKTKLFIFICTLNFLVALVCWGLNHTAFLTDLFINYQSYKYFCGLLLSINSELVINSVGLFLLLKIEDFLEKQFPNKYEVKDDVKVTLPSAHITSTTESTQSESELIQGEKDGKQPTK